MAKYRMVRTEFWKNPIVMEEMSPEDKYFYLYLLTNPQTTQIGIYKITKKQMAFDLGYSIESVQSIMERFIQHHKLIRYNPETRELAIKNWGKDNLLKGGKPVIDCISSELIEVEDLSLIRYVGDSILKQDIRSLYESFYQQEEMILGEEEEEENDPYFMESDELNDLPLQPQTNLEQKEQNAFNPDIVSHFTDDVKEIMEFWDANGFGFTNVNAKQQLLSWLDDSSFLQPKEVILKAMKIACANNKRTLHYLVGILKNWENQSLLSVEEIDTYGDFHKPVHKSRPFTDTPPAGREIRTEFILDLTAGEKE